MKPKIAALITASGGIGSHFVLHKLQGHKNIVTLKESAFRGQAGSSKGDLKRYLSQGILPNLDPEQLHPKKQIATAENKWLIMNKPPLKMINYHRTFHPDMPVLYIFRNPVSFYFTWIKKWREYGNKRYGRTVSDEQVFDWFRTTFMSSLFELAQNFDPTRDNIISFEHFFNDVDGELQRIFNCLGVENIRSKDLDTMKVCNVCGSEKVEVKKLKVRAGRYEDVLYCHRHGAVLGPGEYNYIRKEDPSFLSGWKNNDNVKEISEKFTPMFGKELIDYFYNEEYLIDKQRANYDALISDFLGGLKV
jgi:hypothetical protein